MTSPENCDYCNKENIDWRSITKGPLATSFVSNPRFREGQCLVIPNRHVTRIEELDEAEASSIMLELGRLSIRLDDGFGSGIMQKYQPLQAENGVKTNHLHFHVFPRLENEVGLFPVPDPNSFDGFERASTDEIIDLAESLK